MAIWNNVKKTLAQAGLNGQIASVSVDAWGCDFALLDIYGGLVENLVSYRDQPTNAMRPEMDALVPGETLYETIGVPAFFSSIAARLFYLNRYAPRRLDAAESILFLPDYIHFLLCGEKTCEYTIASTSQLLRPDTACWSSDIMRRLGIPERLFPEVRPSGTLAGRLQCDLQTETGLGSAEVRLSCGHDSACAMLAVPAAPCESWVAISSGTWSIIACELSENKILKQGLHYGFSHEGVFGGKMRLTKNQIGLWMLQQHRRALAASGQDYDFDALEKLAAQVPAWQSIIVPDYDLILEQDIGGAIRDFCQATRQYVPITAGEIARCIIDSLALCYATVFQEMEEITGYRFATVHIVGGGAKSGMLCQLTADVTGKPVLAGPCDAASVGNILGQLLGKGEIATVEQARLLSRISFPPKLFEPGKTDSHREALRQYRDYSDRRLRCGKKS